MMSKPLGVLVAHETPMIVTQFEDAVPDWETLVGAEIWPAAEGTSENPVAVVMWVEAGITFYLGRLENRDSLRLFAAMLRPHPPQLALRYSEDFETLALTSAASPVKGGKRRGR